MAFQMKMKNIWLFVLLWLVIEGVVVVAQRELWGRSSRLVKQSITSWGVRHQALSNIRAGGSTVTSTTTTKKTKTITPAQYQALNLLSGGVAGTVSSVLTNPLEVIKTRLQQSSSSGPLSVAKRIFQMDGPAGFFRGLPPTLLGIIPSRSIYFFSYQSCKRALAPQFAEGSPANAVISGLLAGILGNTVTNPIWMVRTRMQLLVDSAAGQRVYAGYRDAISSIWKQEGIGGFYKGITASYWGCLEGATQFLVYEQLKARLRRQRRNEGKDDSEDLSKFSLFVSAAISKATASIATYPHEVARTRLREQARGGVFKYTGMWQTLRLVAKEEGRRGLYAGMGIHLIKVVPNSALMFLTYEIVTSWLRQYKVQAPQSTTTTTGASKTKLSEKTKTLKR